MGQDLSQLTENVPSLLGSVLLKMGQEVAMDLHESSMQDIFEQGDDGDNVIAEEEGTAMTSPRYFGIWQDEKGRPFYYDVEHKAYFFLENPQAPKIACERLFTTPATTTNNPFHHNNNNNNNNNNNIIREEEADQCSASSTIPSSSPKQPPISFMTPAAPAVSHLSFLTRKIMTDLGIIYSNVTHSVSMLLERGDGLEQTRRKLDEMMDVASSLERQSRCLACAHRCNSIWPGTGYTFILKIADIIPMSACCQDDGVCGPYVYMSEDEGLDDDIDLDGDFQHAETIPDNLTDCHLE